MPSSALRLLFALTALTFTAHWLWAAEEDKWKLPEEDCRVPYCVIKPVKKPIKKTFYCVKRIPYCPHGCPCPCDGSSCNHCPKCSACPCYRNVLLKKEIVIGETCDMKCVIEYQPACQPGGPVEEIPPPPKARKPGPTAGREGSSLPR